MGMLLCVQNFRDVWIRNKSVRAEIGQILHTDTHPHTHTHTHTHTTAAKLVVRMKRLIADWHKQTPAGLPAAAPRKGNHVTFLHVDGLMSGAVSKSLHTIKYGTDVTDYVYF